MSDREKSDRLVVPSIPPNNPGEPGAEAGEGRGLPEGNAASETRSGPSAGVGVSSELDRVRQVAGSDREVRFTALLHHVTVDRLRGAYRAISPDAAPGVDGVTWRDYGQELELQCHIGTDTVSLSRLGARMTGLDLSPASLREARRLAELTCAPVRFVEADVYSALEGLEPESFDLVYTGIGALCWLPDIDRWARTVAGLLRAGGRLFIREMHPMLSSIDEAHTDLIVVDYPYFERPEPMVFNDGGTYVQTDTEFAATVTHEWSHGLGETITALLNTGMQLTAFTEHDSVPWQALPGHMTQDECGEWRLTDRPWRLAASFTLQARRV